jgi:hypothetical protein
VAVLALASAGVAFAQQLDCSRCHGELELLRQHVASLADARALLVPEAVLAESAHGGISCGECHNGFGRFPHPATGRTDSCASCHEAAAAEWTTGVHARMDATERVTCSACHGIHDVADTTALSQGPRLTAMNESCTACHETQRLTPEDPHAQETGCWACHAPHSTHAADASLSWVAPMAQPRTCGACHDAVSTVWVDDVHGSALMSGNGTDGEIEPPACTSCHGAHPIHSAGDREFSVAAVDRCAACHEHAAETFFGSYHGKATALGSTVSATCAQCHGAHTILPDEHPASSVAASNLVETCSDCHPQARASFVTYDSHPDPMDRERNPVLFYSFWFMNALLVGVLGVFGLHTVLWWVRLMIDRRRGGSHG